MKVHALWYIFLTALFWALLWIMWKFALKFMSRDQVIFRRSISAFIVFTILFYRSISFNIIRYWQFWLLGVIGFCNVFLFMYWIQYTSAGMWQLMYLSIPLFVIVLNFFFFSFFPKRIQLVWVVLWTLGILLLLYQGRIDVDGSSIFGNLLILSAAFIHALFIILSKKYQELLWPWIRVFAFAVSSILIMLLFSAYTSTITLPSKSWIYAWILLWILSIALHYSTQLTNQKFWTLISSAVLYIQPFMGLLIANIVLWESVSILTLVWWLISVCWAYLISRY